MLCIQEAVRIDLASTPVYGTANIAQGVPRLEYTTRPGYPAGTLQLLEINNAPEHVSI